MHGNVCETNSCNFTNDTALANLYFMNISHLCISYKSIKLQTHSCIAHGTQCIQNTLSMGDNITSEENVHTTCTPICTCTCTAHRHKCIQCKWIYIYIPPHSASYNMHISKCASAPRKSTTSAHTYMHMHTRTRTHMHTHTVHTHT